METGKNFKIWGIGYGLIGDIIMALPLLAYFEKMHPDSYKIVVIEKKCSVCAPLFFNHPLIDRIKITDEWNGVGEEDIRLASQCQITDLPWTGKLGERIPPFNGSWNKDPHWYNYTDCIDVTAKRYGVDNIKEKLTEEELYPKLYKWFNVGLPDTVGDTYAKSYTSDTSMFSNDVAIWPFATGATGHGRSPTIGWWQTLIEKLTSMGFTVSHYGRPTETQISVNPNYTCYTYLSYIEQVQAALASRFTIGTDSGAMWVMGAYSHPSITLMTQYLQNHVSNPMALAPANKNGANIFAKGGCENIKFDDVLHTIEEKIIACGF